MGAREPAEASTLFERYLGSTPTGATAEVVRRQPDGSWKCIIDNPDGTALLSHE